MTDYTDLFIEPVKFEPYDDETPRLSYSQVATCVHSLPLDMIEALMRGPIEERRRCNVCESLAGLDTRETRLLKWWHDNLANSTRFFEIIEGRIINPDNMDFLNEELKQMFGSIMYARCCVIYALARVEVQDRRKE